MNIIQPIRYGYNNRINTHKSNPIFRGSQPVADTFERTKSDTVDVVKVKNPYNGKVYKLEIDEDINLLKSQELRLKGKRNRDFYLDYNPNKRDYLFDNNSGKKIEIAVLESENRKNPDEFCYHFFSTDLKKCYGYAFYQKSSDGIEEIKIEAADKNNLEEIHTLADKHAVAYCKFNKILKNIVSYPKPKDYKLNYEKGMRFFIPEKDSEQYRFFMEKYGNDDPNRIINDENIDTTKWPSLKMSLSKRLTKNYSKKFPTGNFIVDSYFDNEKFYTYTPIDVTQPITLKWQNSFPFKDDFYVDFDPERTGKLYDKEKGEPIDVFILKSHHNNEEVDGYYFYSKDLKTSYGKVFFEALNDSKKYTDSFQNENIDGKYLKISWLENCEKNKIGGVGKLADKLESKYCKEHDIPNILSIAEDDSYMAHYKRGKRFLIPKDGDTRDFLMNTYGTIDPNFALQSLLEESEETGKKVDMTDWNKYNFFMCLPKDLMKKYAEE